MQVVPEKAQPPPEVTTTPDGPLRAAAPPSGMPAALAAETFDRVAALAAAIFAVPIAGVSMIGHDRVWLLASHGLEGIGYVGDEPGLCVSAVRSGEPYVVTDAAADPRTLGHSLVRGEPGLRFYAAAPVTLATGQRVGTVHVADRVPRDVVPPAQLGLLADLAAIVADHLELRLATLPMPLTCQLGASAPCRRPPELKVADSWGDSAWGCVQHVEEVLLSGASVFVADESLSGLAAFRRRGRHGHPGGRSQPG